MLPLSVTRLISARQNIRRLGAEFSWVLAGQIAATAGSVVSVRVLTAYLTPLVYGQVALALTVATIAQQVALGPLGQGAMRYYSSANESGQIRSYAVAVSSLAAKASAVLVFIYSLVALVALATGHSQWIRLLIPTVLYALVTGASGILDGMQNAARQRAIVAFHQGLGQWLRMAAVAIPAALFGPSVAAVLYGFTAAAAAILISQALFFTSRLYNSSPGVSSGPNVWTAKLVSYSWPFSTWGLFGWAQSVSDRWALQAFGSSSEVGLYAVLYQLGYTPIVLIAGLSVQLLGPVLFHRCGDGTDPSRVAGVGRMIDRLTLGALVLTLLATCLAAVCHTFLFGLIVGERFRQTSFLLPPMVMSGGLFATGQIAALALMSTSESKRLIAPKIGSACFGVPVTFLATFLGGMAGTVYALVLSAALYCAWVVWLSKHSDIKKIGQQFQSDECRVSL